MPDGRETAEEIARVLEGDAEGEAFHGPALATVLKGMGAADGARRPISGAHSIAEILEHVVAWREWTVARLEARPMPNPSEDGWVRRDAVDAAAWEDLRARLAASSDRLRAAMARLAGTDLERHRDLCRFALHHELHHLGQVSLLRRAGAR